MALAKAYTTPMAKSTAQSIAITITPVAPETREDGIHAESRTICGTSIARIAQFLLTVALLKTVHTQLHASRTENNSTPQCQQLTIWTKRRFNKPLNAVDVVLGTRATRGRFDSAPRSE